MVNNMIKNETIPFSECRSTIKFEVPGEPKSKLRAKNMSFTKNGRMFVKKFDPNVSRYEWLGSFAIDHAPAKPWEGPVGMSVIYFMPIPKSRPKWKRHLCQNELVNHTNTPDLDNLNKLVLDTLTKCGFWKDDSQVCNLNSEKVYSMKPHTYINVSFLHDMNNTEYQQAMKNGAFDSLNPLI